MKITSDSLKHNQPIPTQFAFGKHNPTSNVELSDNKNPHIGWSDLPNGTKSLVLICKDVDVPTSPENVNKEGMTVPASLKRADFFHWVLVDIAPNGSPINEGEFCNGVTARGKNPGTQRGTRSGINNYTQWFEGDPDMQGKYFGYDGPCPPWNDEIIHHYDFTLYALDIEKCPIDGEFYGPDVLKAIQGHILDQDTIIGTYHIYPNAK